jgi:hypothetical protein
MRVARELLAAHISSGSHRSDTSASRAGNKGARGSRGGRGVSRGKALDMSHPLCGSLTTECGWLKTLCLGFHLQPLTILVAQSRSTEKPRSRGDSSAYQETHRRATTASRGNIRSLATQREVDMPSLGNLISPWPSLLKFRLTDLTW